MSHLPQRGRRGRSPGGCPPTADGPSLGTIIAGIAGLAGAIGLGYLLGSSSRDDSDEEKETAREVQAQRQRVQRTSAQDAERKDAHDRSQSAAVKAYQEHAGGGAGSSSAALGSSSSGPVAIAAFPSSVPSSSSSSSSADPSCSSSSGNATLQQQLDDAVLCKVCYDAPMDVVLWPCRHQCCCHSCSEQLTHCPVCRSEFTSAERVYRA